MFTLWPFRGANDNTQFGCVSATVTGFQTGGVGGDDSAFIDGIPEGPMVSLYFTKLYAESIGIGEHSKIMDVLSQDSPGIITGNIIGGTVGSGPVVGPAIIPEPGTLTSAYRRTDCGVHHQASMLETLCRTELQAGLNSV